MKSGRQIIVLMPLVVVLIGQFFRDVSSKRESCSDWSVVILLFNNPSIVC